jgi:hypothetical protein
MIGESLVFFNRDDGGGEEREELIFDVGLCVCASVGAWSS